MIKKIFVLLLAVALVGFAFLLPKKELAAALSCSFNSNRISAIKTDPFYLSDEPCARAFETAQSQVEGNTGFIRWVDFNASYEILQQVYNLSKDYHDSDIAFDFIEVLAYLTVKNGNNFSAAADSKNLKSLIGRLKGGETVSGIMGENKYYKYYLEAYSAIFKEFLGEYMWVDAAGEMKTDYGLIAYSPIAKGYWYSDYDDFGSRRSYGFKRKHLGHDLMGSVGTPIIAIEGGTVTELGWNRYGGWRVGIRSFDQRRYYYYAHLRKNRPFAAGLKVGDSVEAGQVIGYLGVTGYSSQENVNMKISPHLHLGLQLIFDESQEDGGGEIWIDLYSLTKFLLQNRASVVKDPQTKEYKSIGLRRKIPQTLPR